VPRDALRDAELFNRRLRRIQNFRRLRIRREKSTKLFQGFLRPASTLLLSREQLLILLVCRDACICVSPPRPSRRSRFP
jgi:hypothetical protein